MSTLADAWRAFLSATLGQAFGSTSDLQLQFANKYANGLDSYMNSLIAGNTLRYLRSGLYYTFDDAAQDGTVALSQDGLILAAFTVGNTCQVNQISLEVTIAGAGSNVDLVLYDSLNGVPNNKLISQNISGAATGIITAAITPLTLTPGFYWIGYVAHTATPPTVRAKSTFGTKFTGQATGGNVNATGYQVLGQSTAPGNAPAVGVAQPANIAKVMLRVV